MPMKQNIELYKEDEIESDLIIIGLAGIADPLRPEVRKAVEKCHIAGITVRMITGGKICI
jgi:P-type E1-E2 ATPase